MMLRDPVYGIDAIHLFLPFLGTTNFCNRHFLLAALLIQTLTCCLDDLLHLLWGMFVREDFLLCVSLLVSKWIIFVLLSFCISSTLNKRVSIEADKVPFLRAFAQVHFHILLKLIVPYNLHKKVKKKKKKSHLPDLKLL